MYFKQLEDVVSNADLSLHDHKVGFLSRRPQSIRQLSILNAFEVHTWEYIPNKRIKPLGVCKGQLR